MNAIQYPAWWKILLAMLLSWGAYAQAQEAERRFKVLTLDEMTPAQRAVADKIRSGPRASVSGSAANSGNSVVGCCRFRRHRLKLLKLPRTVSD